MIILRHTNEKKTLIHLGLKIALGWTSFLILLLALRFWIPRGSIPSPLGDILGAVGGGLVVWVTFGPLINVAYYHALPGFALLDDEIVIKPGNSFQLRSYKYSDIVNIQQIEIKHDKGNGYCLALTFADGVEWKTRPQERASVPAYVQISQFILGKSSCSISPAFEDHLVNPYTDREVEGFQDKFARKRRSQVVGLMLMGAAGVLILVTGVVELSNLLQWVLRGVALLIMMGCVVFEWVNWRCPACGAVLGDFGRTQCRKCGLELGR